MGMAVDPWFSSNGLALSRFRYASCAFGHGTMRGLAARITERRLGFYEAGRTTHREYGGSAVKLSGNQQVRGC